MASVFIFSTSWTGGRHVAQIHSSSLASLVISRQQFLQELSLGTSLAAFIRHACPICESLFYVETRQKEALNIAVSASKGPKGEQRKVQGSR
jgi:hypothetical protein